MLQCNVAILNCIIKYLQEQLYDMTGNQKFVLPPFANNNLITNNQVGIKERLINRKLLVKHQCEVVNSTRYEKLSYYNVTNVLSICAVPKVSMHLKKQKTIQKKKNQIKLFQKKQKIKSPIYIWDKQTISSPNN